MKVLLNVVSVLLLAPLTACLTPAAAGKDYFPPSSASPSGAVDRSVGMVNPGDAGTLEVKSFLYASPYNPRRPEYSRDKVSLVAPTVDLEPFYPDVRKAHWGFDSHQVPLNAVVYYPSVGVDSPPQRYPLVVLVHGNHEPGEASEFGYEYLGRHLASRGYILASIDENFLNGDASDENDARAILLLEHAKQIVAWSEDSATPFYHVVDTSKIFLGGHSRGGEASYVATVFNNLDHYPDNGMVKLNYHLSVLGAFSLAPVEGQYRPQHRLVALSAATSYLSLHGGMDGDVEDHFGELFVRRGQPAPGSFRSAVWVYGANHAQFNTTWSRLQDPSPTLQTLLITAEQQRRVATVFVTAFLDSVVDGSGSEKQLFSSPREFKSWLPETRYATLYRGGEQFVLADFEEDALLTTTLRPDWAASADGFRIWTEDQLQLNPAYLYLPLLGSDPIVVGALSKQDHVLTLTWGQDPKKPGPSATPTTPAVYALTTKTPVSAASLSFELGVMALPEGTKTLDLTVVIETGRGTRVQAPLSKFVQPGLLPETWVFPYSTVKQSLETLVLPLSGFEGFGPGDTVTGIEFLYDKTPQGQVLIDHISLLPRTAK